LWRIKSPMVQKCEKQMKKTTKTFWWNCNLVRNLMWRNRKSQARPKMGLGFKNVEVWGLEGTLPALSTKRGRGACWSSGMGLGRRTSLFTYSQPAIKPITRWLVHLWKHSRCWDTPWATRIHLTHHGSNSGKATTFPHIVFFVLLYRTHAQMAFCPNTPKVESRNCPGLDSRDFGTS